MPILCYCGSTATSSITPAGAHPGVQLVHDQQGERAHDPVVENCDIHPVVWVVRHAIEYLFGIGRGQGLAVIHVGLHMETYVSGAWSCWFSACLACRLIRFFHRSAVLDFRQAIARASGNHLGVS